MDHSGETALIFSPYGNAVSVISYGNYSVLKHCFICRRIYDCIELVSYTAVGVSYLSSYASKSAAGIIGNFLLVYYASCYFVFNAGYGFYNVEIILKHGEYICFIFLL